jgi:hypothetical protein
MDTNETLALIADAASAAEWYAAQGRLDNIGYVLDAMACVARGTSHVSQRVMLDVLVEDWKRETAVVEVVA